MSGRQLARLLALRQLREDAARRDLGLAVSAWRSAEAAAQAAAGEVTRQRGALDGAVATFTVRAGGGPVGPEALAGLRGELAERRGALAAAQNEVATARDEAAAREEAVTAARERHRTTERAARRLAALADTIATERLRREEIAEEMSGDMIRPGHRGRVR